MLPLQAFVNATLALAQTPRTDRRDQDEIQVLKFECYIELDVDVVWCQWARVGLSCLDWIGIWRNSSSLEGGGWRVVCR